jgi:hypothetical protein
MIRQHKESFRLSDATCTLRRRPPSALLAALSVTAPTRIEQKRLVDAEKQFVEQYQTQQLREYKHEKEQARMESIKLHDPEPAIIELDRQDEHGGWQNEEAALSASMEAVFHKWLQAQKEDNVLSSFVPSANTPPAALRFYGTMKRLPPSPFLSSSARLPSSSSS